ncbi:2,4-dichlorophenol 6-monooxygenase [Sesbania bispinosa]|nr:2,4-dichlorophenol 6-monooxygenase [Sesbania bispinosa]
MKHEQLGEYGCLQGEQAHRQPFQYNDALQRGQNIFWIASVKLCNERNADGMAAT